MAVAPVDVERGGGGGGGAGGGSTRDYGCTNEMLVSHGLSGSVGGGLMLMEEDRQEPVSLRGCRQKLVS